MQSPSFLSLSYEEEEKCLICNKCFSDKEKAYNFGEGGWENFKSKAKKWQTLDIPEDNEYFIYTTVYETISNFNKTFGKSHRNCKKAFDLRYQKIKEKYGEKVIVEQGK